MELSVDLDRIFIDEGVFREVRARKEFADKNSTWRRDFDGASDGAF